MEKSFSQPTLLKNKSYLNYFWFTNLSVDLICLGWKFLLICFSCKLLVFCEQKNERAKERKSKRAKKQFTLFQEQLFGNRSRHSLKKRDRVKSDGAKERRERFTLGHNNGEKSEKRSKTRDRHPFFSKERNVLAFFCILIKRTKRSRGLYKKNDASFAFFYILYKRMRHSFHSFMFFIKESGVLCAILHSL